MSKKLDIQITKSDNKINCNYLGCNKVGTVLDDVEVSPGVIEKKMVCEEHKGQLTGHIALKGKRIKKRYTF